MLQFGTPVAVVALVALVACAPPSGPEAVPVADPDDGADALVAEAPWEAPPRALDTGSQHRRLERCPKVRVTSTEQLLGALTSRHWIELAGGRYDLSGLEVVLSEITDLVIEGPVARGEQGAEPAVLYSSQCTAPLLSFVDCENVELRGLTLERRSAEQGCEQPLLMARAGYRLTLVDCQLVGGGTAAAVTRYNAFYLVGGTVSECRRVLVARNSKHLGLEGTLFEHNTGESLFRFRGRDTRHISLSACRIVDNDLGADGGIFDLDASSLPVDVIDCLFSGNTAGALVIGPGAARLALRGCRMQEF